MNILRTLRNSYWKNTPLQDLLQHMNAGADEQKPCRSFDIKEMQPKDLRTCIDYFTCTGGVNTAHLFNMGVDDYDWFNKFLRKWNLTFDENCFTDTAIKITALHNINPQQLYALHTEDHLYLIFFNCDVTQLIIACVRGAYTARWDEYEDMEDGEVGVYQVIQRGSGYRFDVEQKVFRYFPHQTERILKYSIKEGDGVMRLPSLQNLITLHKDGTTATRRIVVIDEKYYFFARLKGESGPGFTMLDDETFFSNLYRICCIKNIADLHDISVSDFWEICYALCLVKQISPNSGVARILKYKLIIINKLMGFDRFNEHKFKLNDIHFNRIKNEYYFTRSLSLADVLKFDFITSEERTYIYKIINKTN